MKKLIGIFSALLIIFSLGMIILYGASGHGVNFENFETQIYLSLIILYFSTAVILLIFIYKGNLLIKKVASALVSLVLISFIYLFYEIFKVKIGDYSVIIPIVIMLMIVFLGTKTLFYLLKENPQLK